MGKLNKKDQAKFDRLARFHGFTKSEMRDYAIQWYLDSVKSPTLRAMKLSADIRKLAKELEKVKHRG